MSRNDPAVARKLQIEAARYAALQDMATKRSNGGVPSEHRGSMYPYSRAELDLISQSAGPPLTHNIERNRAYIGPHALSLGYGDNGWKGVEQRTRHNAAYMEKLQIEASRRAVGGDLEIPYEPTAIVSPRAPSTRQEDRRSARTNLQTPAVPTASRIMANSVSAPHENYPMSYAPLAPVFSEPPDLRLQQILREQQIASTSPQPAQQAASLNTFKVPRKIRPTPAQDAVAGAAEPLQDTSQRYNGSTGSPAILDKLPSSYNTSAYTDPRQPTDTQSYRPKDRSVGAEGKIGQKRRLTIVDPHAGPLTLKDGWFLNRYNKFQYKEQGVFDAPEFVLREGFEFAPSMKKWVRLGADNEVIESTSTPPYAINEPWKTQTSRTKGRIYYFNPKTGVSEWPIDEASLQYMRDNTNKLDCLDKEGSRHEARRR